MMGKRCYGTQELVINKATPSNTKVDTGGLSKLSLSVRTDGQLSQARKRWCGSGMHGLDRSSVHRCLISHLLQHWHTIRTDKHCSREATTGLHVSGTCNRESRSQRHCVMTFRLLPWHLVTRKTQSSLYARMGKFRHGTCRQAILKAPRAYSMVRLWRSVLIDRQH